MKRQNAKKVYVAMSGGVDSSVSAAILVRDGFDVVGVYMKPWQPKGINCMWQTERLDAMRVATGLNIPFKTWDFSREYGKKVAGYMIQGYKKGITPNPDVLCNKEIKFGLFLKRALKEGADMIATGHYSKITKKGERYILAKGKDPDKDQSYFLWTLTNQQLKYTLFPIGNMLKSEVRRLAGHFGLSVSDKKDSQGVCFVGDLDVKSFLKSNIKSKKGKIVDMSARVLGEHDGAYYYTIGQRHGLDIKTGGGPYYVVSTDIRKNIVRVGCEKDLYKKEIRLKNVILHDKFELPLKVSVKIRYRTKAVPCVLDKNHKLVFAKPQRAPAPGQFAVFYMGDKVIGGGVISG